MRKHEPIPFPSLLILLLLLVTGLTAEVASAQTCTLPDASTTTPAWINVKKDCGAVGNGGTDDTLAFQKAFNTLAGLTSGGTIYCPPGEYPISGSTGVSVSNVGGIRFLGDSGPSVNEAATAVRGCTLLAETTGMTVLTLDGKSGTNTVNHLGPVVEYVNFRDVSNGGAGHTATLLKIASYNDWTARNVSVNKGAIGLLIDGTVTGDASWGYIPQLICYLSDTCIDSERGGFLALGGRYQPTGKGIVAKFPQARIQGIKMDCNGVAGGSASSFVGIELSGHGNQVEGSNFEGGCQAYVDIHSGGTGGNDGSGNIVVGNRFYCLGFAGCQGAQVGVSAAGTVTGTVIADNHFQVPSGGVGVTIASNAQSTVLSGNSYTGGGSVSDASTSTVRYEQGFAGISGIAAPSGACTPGTLFFNKNGTQTGANTLFVCTNTTLGGTTWLNVK